VVVASIGVHVHTTFTSTAEEAGFDRTSNGALPCIFV
jgi:hypothetical protein